MYMCMHICLHMDTHVTTHTVGRGSWCCRSPGLCARWMSECMASSWPLVIRQRGKHAQVTTALSDPLQCPGRRWLPGCSRLLLWPVIGSQERGHLAVQMASCLFRRQMLGLALGAPRPDASASPHSQQTTTTPATWLACCKIP